MINVWLLVGLILFIYLWYVYLSRVYFGWSFSQKELPVTGMGLIVGLAFLSSTLNEIYFSWWIYVAVISLTVLGLLDDKFDLSVGLRLAFHILTAISLFFIPHSFHLVALVFAGVTWMNVFNFMDGSNGMLGLYALINLFFAFWWNVQLSQQPDVSQVIILLVTALALFLFGNFRRKALWMAGDAGSIPLGFLILILWLYVLGPMPVVSKALYLIGSCAVFLTDTGLTLMLRTIQGKSVFRRHQQHLYQLLVYKKGYGHLFVALCYTFVQVVINMALIFAFRANTPVVWVFIPVMAFLIATWSYLYKKYYKIDVVRA